MRNLSRPDVLPLVAGGAVLSVVLCAYRYRRSKARSTLDDDSELHLFEEATDSSTTKNDCIYLDYNGTTPIYSHVLKAMMPFLTTHFANPSSGHCLAVVPRQAVTKARLQIANALLAADTQDPSCIWFTSCGTESDNLAIQVALQANRHMANIHIVTCNVEHMAVATYLRVLQEEQDRTSNLEVTYVPVQPDGRVKAANVIAAIRPNTVLVTVMYANNETGALMPIQEIAQACRERKVLFHTDAAQAAGKVDCSLRAMGYPDMVSLVGHKLGAPKGIACLYVRPNCYNEGGRQLHNHGILLIGGGQEHGRRGGTENVPYIVGMGAAAEVAAKHLTQNAVHMEALRSRLLSKLEDELGVSNVRANGPMDPSQRLPNTLSVGIKGVHSGELLKKIGDRVAASAGATCHSACGVSSVLRAMNVPIGFAQGTLRLSVGPKTTFDEIDRATEVIIEEAERMARVVAV